VTEHADPRPAQLPLPGGVDGSTVRVHPLRSAEEAAPPSFLQRPSGPLAGVRALGLHIPRSRWNVIPLTSFAIEHPGAGAFLVDAGIHAEVADDPAANLGRLGAAVHRVRMKPEWAVPAQLRERDIDPATVQLVVMTHLHYDHASGISQFPQATFVVDRNEWSFASHHGLLNGYHRPHFDRPLAWRTLDYEAPSVEGFATFGRSIDIFGDGSVRLLSTPGHSPGHQCLLVRLGEGRELLIVADAAYAQRSIDEDLVPYFYDDLHLYRRSLAEIRRYLELNPETVAICCHDAVHWPRLAPVYA
jgi:N-acyl homoserine lactone hydrolase